MVHQLISSDTEMIADLIRRLVAANNQIAQLKAQLADTENKVRESLDLLRD